MREAEGKEACH